MSDNKTSKPTKSKKGKILTVVYLLSACVLIYLGLPHIFWKPTNVVSTVKTFTFNNPVEPLQIEMKLTSKEGFIAGNPIEIEYTTTWPLQKISSVQLEFFGAERPLATESEDGDYLDDSSYISSASSSETAAGMKFFGTKELTYESAGNFNIGLTLVGSGAVSGSGVGQDEGYIANEQLSISAPETLSILKTNELVIGLSLITLAIPFLIEGLRLLVEW